MKIVRLLVAVLLCARTAAAQNPVTLVGTPTVDVVGALYGTAGVGSTRVLTVQGNASGTPVPISGTITANLGSLNGLFLDATFTGRMPAGASPANGESNTSTTLSRIGVYNFFYNGATWDRWTGAVTGSGTFTVGQATGTNLHMVCDSGCSGSAGFADNSAFTFGTTAINPIGGVLDDVATNTATENSAAVARITPQKALHINLRNQAGTEIGTSSTPVQVTLANTGANTNKLLVTPDSVALPANQSVNVSQLAGTTTDTNSGNKSAGTMRVVLATDQPALTNKLLVTPDSVALPANQSVNVAQINGVATTMGNGVSGTGVQRVTIASDSTGTIVATSATAANLLARTDTSGATGAAPPARADYVGGLGAGATGGFVIGVPVCDSVKAVSMTSATTTLMVTGVSGRHVRICSISLVTAIANNVAFLSGTGATCGTGTAGMAGGTTAANGYNFAANGGITLGGGLGTVMQTAATGDSVCIVTSAAGPLAGTIGYTIY